MRRLHLALIASLTTIPIVACSAHPDEDDGVVVLQGVGEKKVDPNNWGFDDIDFCLLAFDPPKVDKTSGNVTFYPDQADFESADADRADNMRMDPKKSDVMSANCQKTSGVAMRKCKMVDKSWQVLSFTADARLYQESIDPDSSRISWRRDPRGRLAGTGVDNSCGSKQTTTGFGGDGLHCGTSTDVVTTYNVTVSEGWEGKIEGSIGFPLGPVGVQVGGGIAITTQSGSSVTQQFTQRCSAEVKTAGSGCSCAEVSCEGECELGRVSDLAVMRACFLSYRVASATDTADAARMRGSRRVGNAAIQVAKVALNDMVGPAKVGKLEYQKYGCADSPEDAAKKVLAPNGQTVPFCGVKAGECKAAAEIDTQKLEEQRKRLLDGLQQFGYAPTAPSDIGVASMRFAKAESANTDYWTWADFVSRNGQESLSPGGTFDSIDTSGWKDGRVLSFVVGDPALPIAPVFVKQNAAPSNSFSLTWIGPRRLDSLDRMTIDVTAEGGLSISARASGGKVVVVGPNDDLEAIASALESAAALADVPALPTTLFAAARVVGSLRGVSSHLADELRRAPLAYRISISNGRLSLTKN